MKPTWKQVHTAHETNPELRNLTAKVADAVRAGDEQAALRLARQADQAQAKVIGSDTP